MITKNTTTKGDILEKSIFDLFTSFVESGQFWGNSSMSQVFRKKGYYSRAREKDIIFDVAVEVRLPGADRFSQVTLIECKNYTHSVPVDDVEEFFAKVQQVAPANAKGVLASTAPFQEGTVKYAKAQGIALLRYFDASNFKWELYRSPSVTAFKRHHSIDEHVLEGLSSERFVSTTFDMYMQSPSGLTNSVWDFFEGMLTDSGLTSGELATLRNRRGRPQRLVPFLSQEYLEEMSLSILRDISYSGDAIPLEAICERETARCGLVLKTGVSGNTFSGRFPPLGQISFLPLEITLYEQAIANSGRDRFTLAHELAHHFLSHHKYMSRESCDEGDFSLERYGSGMTLDVARLESQANLFASCLLMPKCAFISNFKQITESFDIADRGFGELYLDDQLCNYQSYRQVTWELMSYYGVSRAAATIRLASLGLLRDVRRIHGQYLD